MEIDTTQYNKSGFRKNYDRTPILITANEALVKYKFHKDNFGRTQGCFQLPPKDCDDINKMYDRITATVPNAILKKPDFNVGLNVRLPRNVSDVGAMVFGSSDFIPNISTDAINVLLTQHPIMKMIIEAVPWIRVDLKTGQEHAGYTFELKNLILCKNKFPDVSDNNNARTTSIV